MPFNHNDHYHRLLLRHVPPGCRTALDVGCGTGTFALRLAQRGIEVDAIDASPEAIAAARAASGGDGPRFRHADVVSAELPADRYDFISCIASLHHVPFDTVAALREALAPDGVLVVLGLYEETTPADYGWSLVTVPVHAAARLAMAAAERIGLRTHPHVNASTRRHARRRCRSPRSAASRRGCCPARPYSGCSSGAVCSSTASRNGRDPPNGRARLPRTAGGPSQHLAQ